MRPRLDDGRQPIAIENDHFLALAIHHIALKIGVIRARQTSTMRLL
jgi:hypothetical protein